mmetsp:Transcript_10909/g.20505  ORF Transcript_10909/g.20505 Transcript_10909/m.20505 type:complete len:252 (+) Transcript_10909:257-1012(+)
MMMWVNQRGCLWLVVVHRRGGRRVLAVVAWVPLHRRPPTHHALLWCGTHRHRRIGCQLFLLLRRLRFGHRKPIPKVHIVLSLAVVRISVVFSVIPAHDLSQSLGNVLVDRLAVVDAIPAVAKQQPIGSMLPDCHEAKTHVRSQDPCKDGNKDWIRHVVNTAFLLIAVQLTNKHEDHEPTSRRDGDHTHDGSSCAVQVAVQHLHNLVRMLQKLAGFCICWIKIIATQDNVMVRILAWYGLVGLISEYLRLQA